MEFIQTQMMIKVLGLNSISRDVSIVENKMTLAERRISKKVCAAKQAGGKTQRDAITKPVRSFEKFQGTGVVRHCREEDLGLRK